MGGESCSKASRLQRGSKALLSCAHLPDHACGNRAVPVTHNQIILAQLPSEGQLMNHTPAHMDALLPQGEQEHPLTLQ